jgi:AcrR family transcriptional regulator
MAATTSRRRAPRKGERTEQAILDTAERLLAKRPLSAIGIDELAAGAGISRPTFYFYFESREAMLRALAGRIVGELHRSGEAWLRRGGESPAAAVHRGIEAHLAVWRAHGPVLRATLRARETDPEMDRFWADVGRRITDVTAEHIEYERRAGVALAGPPPARDLAAVLVGMNVQAFHDASLKRRTAAADRELVDALAAVWLRAVYGTES